MMAVLLLRAVLSRHLSRIPSYLGDSSFTFLTNGLILLQALLPPPPPWEKMAATKAAFARQLKTLIQALPASVAPYSAWTDDLLRNMDQREAWDRFYSRREKNGPPHPFDWFFGYKEISTFLGSILGGLPPGQARVLDVGCGTSSLGLELYRHSSVQVHISCLDFSSAALRGLARMLQDSPPPRHPLSELRCHLGDATKLSHLFAVGSFHLVLDKGTCDSALRGSPRRARQLVSECLRVLSPEGCLVQISDEDPDARVPFLETAGGANIKVGEIANLNGIAYYAYTLSPRAPGPSEVGQPTKSARNPTGEQP